MQEQPHSDALSKGYTVADPELVASLLDNSSVGIWVLDQKFRVVWINHAIEEYFGLQRDAVLGQDKRDLVRNQIKQIVAEPEDFVERVSAAYADNTYVEQFECHILPGEERQERWLEHWSQPIRSGNYTGGRIEHYTDITARKRAERSNRLHINLLDAVEQAVIATDLEGRITYWNRCAKQLYGWSPEEVLGRSILDVTPSPEMQQHAAEIMECVRRGQSWLGEFLVQHRSGATFYAHVVDSPLYDNDGNLAGIVGISMDVSGLKQAEQQLSERTHILETLNRINVSLAAELDLQKLVQDITDAATEVTGAAFGAFFYNLKDESGESYTLYVLSGVPREAFAGFPQPRNTQVFGPTFRGEGTIRLDDVTQDPRYGHNPPYTGMPAGHLPVRSYLAAPVISRGGEVIGGLFFGHPEPGVFQQQAEEFVTGIATQAAIAIENARLYTELRESELRFRTTFDNAAVGIAHVSMAGNWLQVNNRFCEMVGYSADELVRMNIRDLTYPDDLQEDLAQMERLKAGEIEGYTLEKRYMHKQGQIVWASLTRSLQYNATGEPAYAISIIQDITARRQIEAERERLVQELAAERAQLEKRVRARTRQVRALAAKLSLAEHQERERISHLLHDHVQQMLYAVQMRTHLIELELASYSDGSVLDQLQEMKHLTSEAIRASRTLTVDLSPPVLRDEGLPEALMWLATQMQEIYGLKVKIQSSGYYRISNKGLSVLLFQFVRELLFNVVKHANTDAATVLLRQKPGELLVSVIDNGRGFDAAHLPQSEDVQTGFGLHSIRDRLTLFGGEIRINSSPGAGTEVTITLPLPQEQVVDVK